MPRILINFLILLQTFNNTVKTKEYDEETMFKTPFHYLTIKKSWNLRKYFKFDSVTNITCDRNDPEKFGND